MKSALTIRNPFLEAAKRWTAGKLDWWITTFAIGVLCAATAIAASAQTFNALANFEGSNGANPDYVSLVQGVDGNFYGTTLYGGKLGNLNCASYYQGCGAVFKVTPTGTLTGIYNFCGDDTECLYGGYPQAGLILATDRNFYGTTTGGGQYGGGIVFRITPSGTLTRLYNFCGQRGCVDPYYPEAPLIQGTDGNFYGTTSSGGHVTCNSYYGCGTLFEMTPQGSLSKVYRFCAKANCPDGYSPYAGLAQGTDGNFYGTTLDGGANNSGTVFKITPGGSLTTLYNFCSQPNCSDGAGPRAGLIQATDGNFYGTTTGGSGNSNCFGFGCGTIFKITPTGALTTLYNFCAQPNCADGFVPYAGLIQATDGNFYGTTAYGGTDLIDCTSSGYAGCGTVFQMTPGGTLTTLHSFANTDGANPFGGLFQATNGTLYGTTNQGGNLSCLDPQYSCGTVFSLDMGLAPFVSFIRGFGKVGQTGGILGQGFTGTTSVSFNGTPASFKVVSDTFLTATVPAGATTGLVTVTTPSGTLQSNVPFRVMPQILGFSPTSGPVGTQVTITGVSLTQTLGVGFGDHVPAQFTVNSDTQVTATVPTGAKTGPVGVETQGGIAVSSAIFTVTQ